MTTRTPKRVKSEAEKASDRLRRQQVKKRGERWEDMLAAGFADMTAPHSIRKLDPPTKMVHGKSGPIAVRVDSGGCDFEGGYRGVVAAIEAKDTADDQFYLDVLKEHQRDRLQLTHRQGGIALLALRMGDESAFRAWALPWSCVSAMIEAGKVKVSVADLESGRFEAYRIRAAASCGKMVAAMTPVLEEALFNLRRNGQ